MSNSPAPGMAGLSARPLRVGFAGVGWIGRHRMEALQRSAGVSVSAIADPSPEQIEAALAAAPQARVCGSFEELLAERLDGIAIATPSALHAEQTIQALEAGLAVFCQKPLARTGEETRHVIGTAKRANRLLAVDFSYRFTAGAQRMSELIVAGELGEIYAADLVFHNAYGPDKPWFYKRAESGGGCVIDLGIHLVDLVLWLLGANTLGNVTSSLFAQGYPIARGSDAVEDYAVAQFIVNNRTAVRLACSWRLPAGCDAVIEASLYGTRGGVSFRNVNGSFYDFQTELLRGTSRQLLTAPPDNWGGRAATAWAEALARGPQYDPGIESLIPVAETLDRIYAPIAR
jgi:predicted dehydrogenase